MSVADAEAVLTEVRDGVLLITLNRPDARNAINPALAAGLAAAIDLSRPRTISGSPS